MILLWPYLWRLWWQSPKSWARTDFLLRFSGVGAFWAHFFLEQQKDIWGDKDFGFAYGKQMGREIKTLNFVKWMPCRYFIWIWFKTHTRIRYDLCKDLILPPEGDHCLATRNESACCVKIRPVGEMMSLEMRDRHLVTAAPANFPWSESTTLSDPPWDTLADWQSTAAALYVASFFLHVCFLKVLFRPSCFFPVFIFGGVVGACTLECIVLRNGALHSEL